MGNPTLPAISDAQAASFGSGSPHNETGIAYIPKDTDENDSPPIFTRFIQLFHHLMELLGGVNQGRAYQLTGLNVGCFALEYRIGGFPPCEVVVGNGRPLYVYRTSNENPHRINPSPTLRSSEGWGTRAPAQNNQ